MYEAEHVRIERWNKTMNKDCQNSKAAQGRIHPEALHRDNESPAFSVQEKPKLEEIRKRGVLKVGTAGDFRPMSFLDPASGCCSGFDAYLAEDLASSLCVRAEYVRTSWPVLMDDTLSGKFDLAICGITVTDERKEQALMSDGYLENGKTILCRADDADRFESLAAVNRPGVRVMVNPGGTNELFARSKLPCAALMIHDVNQQIPDLIASGAADVMITETVEARYYSSHDSRLCAPLIDKPFTHAEFGILMPKGAGDLLNYVNEFLAKEKASGRIGELARIALCSPDRAQKEVLNGK